MIGVVCDKEGFCGVSHWKSDLSTRVGAGVGLTDVLIDLEQLYDSLLLEEVTVIVGDLLVSLVDARWFDEMGSKLVILLWIVDIAVLDTSCVPWVMFGSRSKSFL